MTELEKLREDIECLKRLVEFLNTEVAYWKMEAALRKTVPPPPPRPLKWEA